MIKKLTSKQIKTWQEWRNSDKADYGKWGRQTQNSHRYGNSSFWMDDLVSYKDRVEDKFDLLKMVRYQRAIANFVKILAKKDIPVTFSSGDQSYTDGEKKVVIAANINEKSFDVAAGLALHEASHILLTDFEYVKDTLNIKTKAIWLSWHDVCNEKSAVELLKEYAPNLYRDYSTKGTAVTPMFFFSILNFVEDRRIDNVVFRSAPGYKMYYHSLYEKYFLNKDITKGLLSSEYRTEDIKSYEFRVLGLTNPATDPNALKALKKIIQILNIHNISRLEDTADAAKVALQIVDAIHQAIEIAKEPKGGNGQGKSPIPQGSDEQDTQPSPMGGASNGGDEDTDDNNLDPTDGTPTDGSGDESDSTSQGDGPMSNSELSKLEKSIEELRKLLSGEVKKTKAPKAIQKLAAEIGGQTEYSADTVTFRGQKVAVLGLRLSPRMLRSDSSVVGQMVCSQSQEHLAKGGYYGSFPEKGSWWRAVEPKDINEALNLGTMLGRKLKVRDQIRDTKYTRLKTGRIDGRILYQAGFDATNIFSHIQVDKYIPSVIDMSIDASSSMNGTKWINTQKAALAIAKACSMIQNVRVKVSYRYEVSINNKTTVCFVDAYDSKRDQLKHFIDCVFTMRSINCTPDSLVTQYQLDKNLIIPGSSELRSYFINFSDGGPGSSASTVDGKTVQYGGGLAHDHIRKCRKAIEDLNVKVMSFFISERKDGYGTIPQFKNDWGKDNAKFITVTEIMPLAKAMNEMFLSDK